MSNRTRGANVRLIDLTSVEQAATEWWQDHERFESGDRLELSWGPYALLDAADGSTWLVNNEGIGQRISDKPVRLEFFVRNDETSSFGAFPVAANDLTIEEAESRTTGETVDLADFVRRFGARLEGNFHSLFNLTQKGA